MSHIDMHRDLETVPVDGGEAVFVEPNRRYWPNPVSVEYCARIRQADGTSDEHWYDDEGKPLDDASPAIRNIRQVRRIDMRAAFLAGAGGDTAEAGARYDAWVAEWADRKAA